MRDLSWIETWRTLSALQADAQACKDEIRALKQRYRDLGERIDDVEFALATARRERREVFDSLRDAEQRFRLLEADILERSERRRGKHTQAAG